MSLVQAAVPPLPWDILEMIFRFVDVGEHGYLAGVCREWYAVLHDIRTRRDPKAHKWVINLDAFVGNAARAQYALQVAPQWRVFIAGAKHATPELLADLLVNITAPKTVDYGVTDELEEMHTAAALHNNIPVVKYLLGRFCTERYHRFLADGAATNGHLDLLKCLHDMNIGHRLTNIAYKAAGGGHLDVLQWARDTGHPWNAMTTSRAARGGHLKVLRWALANGCDINSHACAEAAGGGHLYVLQWMRREGCHWGIETCAYAARNGHLHVLQWARENGCEWDEGTCYEAAAGGHLHVLKWAREHGCPWGVLTFNRAAQYGHVAVLEWARAHACPWSEETVAYAAREGQLGALQWLRKHGCPWDYRARLWADEQNQREVLTWLYANKYPWKLEDCKKMQASWENETSRHTTSFREWKPMREFSDFTTYNKPM